MRLLLLLLLCVIPNVSFAEKGEKPAPEESAAVAPEAAPPSGDKRAALRAYQRQRLWQSSSERVPFPVRGVFVLLPGSYRIGGVRRGDGTWLGTVDFHRVLGDEAAVAAYEEQRKRHLTGLLVGGGLSAGGVIAGAVMIVGATVRLDTLPGTTNRYTSSAYIGEVRLAQDLQLVGVGVIGVSALGGLITGLVHTANRTRATHIGFQLSAEERQSRIDEFNRSLAEELGLTPEEARELEIRYDPSQGLRIQGELGLGTLGVSGTF